MQTTRPDWPVLSPVKVTPLLSIWHKCKKYGQKSLNSNAHFTEMQMWYFE